MKGNRKYTESMFNKLLVAENISVAALVQHAREKMGYALTNNIAGAMINHQRDFNHGTTCKVLKTFNDMTKKQYTFNDVLEFFDSSE